MERSKEGYASYSLVCDIDSGPLYYYTGYFNRGIPVNTSEYTVALKIPFKDEAQVICDKINAQKLAFSYRVEEHAYF